MAASKPKLTPKKIAALMRVGSDHFLGIVPSCEALYAAAEAIAALIAEYCPIARGTVKLTKTKRRAVLLRTAGLVAIESVPDCFELFASAETIQALIAENCPIASSK